MNFNEVTISNFGTLSEAKVKLDGRGLVLIQGDNDYNSSADSNGAGKSTLFEAISWCLYGKTAKGQTGDSVINWKAKKDCFVQVVLKDGDTEYKITRGRKHKLYKSNLHVKMFTPAGETDLTKGTDKLTQETVEQILGCSYEVFIGAVYAGQERMPDLPAMTDSKLKVLIEEASGANVLDEAYVLARQTLNEAQSKRATGSERVESAQIDARRAKERLKDTLASKQRWDAERDARVIDHEVKAKTLLRDAKSLENQLDSLKSEEELERQRGLNRNKMDRQETEAARLAALEETARLAFKHATGVKAVAETTAQGLKRRREALSALKNHIGKPCTSCLRPHTEESLASAIAEKEVEIEENLIEARKQVEKYKEASKDAQTAEASVSDYRDSMTDMREAVALSEALSDQLSKVKEIKASRQSAIDRAKESTQAIKDERASVNPYVSEIAERKKACLEEIENVKKVEASIEPLDKAVRISQGVVDVYSPKGVRAHILDTVTPYLNERTAHYLGALTDGEIEAIWQTITMTAKGEARENFKIAVTSDGGKGSFTDLSGGEKRKVRVACSLALQDLVSTRASKPLSIFIADEIDDSLDTAGLERLMGILDEKAKERGSVFIISHSDLRDWCSNVLTVKKENGLSKVVQ